MKMKNLYKKRFLSKLIILTVLLLAPITSSAEVGDKKWAKECNKDNKKICVIAVNSQMVITNGDKKKVIATALIQLGTTTESKMDLIDGEEETYKLKKKKKIVSVLFLRLPLNVDLKKQPLIQVDKKNVLNIPYSNCNAKEGCVASTVINDEIVKLFKSGKELTVVMAAHASKNNISMNLPLKNFSKAYDRLSK